MSTTPTDCDAPPAGRRGWTRLSPPVMAALVTLGIVGTVLVTAGGAKAAAVPRQPRPLSGHGLACTTAARVCLSLSDKTAWLLQNGVVIDTVPALGGRPRAEVPIGVFAVTFKDRHHVSSVYHAPMPYSVFFHGGSAFHEGSLTVPSHGCVHLTHAAAVEFYNTLHRGDRIEVVP